MWKDFDRVIFDPDEFLEKCPVVDSTPSGKFELRANVMFTDGVTASIQRSYTHYCDVHLLLYTDTPSKEKSVEIGYPSEFDPTGIDDILAGYAEDPDDYCKTVYGYVGFDILKEWIKRHGGIKSYRVDGD